MYSLAYGDQPALICEQIDWARAAGFEVVAAGKGTKYLPAYHASTPETVWPHYGLTPEQVDRLKDEFAIYAVRSGRINVAGITAANIRYLCESIVKVL